MTQIVVTVDPACALDPRAVAFWVAAVDAQAAEFARAWGVEYTPVVLHGWDVLSKLDGDKVTEFVADSRLLTILPDIDAPGALGFHDDVAGVIFARVKAQGDATSVTLSHEVLEEIGDPTCDLYVAMGDGRETAREACDAVEGDVYAEPASIDTDSVLVAVSNYLLPAWFQAGAAGPFDKMKRLGAPFTMTAGGYMIVRDAAGGETQVFAATDAGRVALAHKLEKRRGRLSRRLRGRWAP